MDKIIYNWRQLYCKTRDAVLNAPLTQEQITTFREQLTPLQPITASGLTQRLAQAYQSLIQANLTYASHQLFFVLNLNHDRTTLTLPISPKQLLEWSNTHSELRSLFTRNPFIYNGLSIDETAAAALL